MTAHTLSGATILQIVPSLRADETGHAGMDVAVTLLQSGARAIVAGEDGPLVGELRALGGEYLPMRKESFNPLQLRSNAAFLHEYVLAERIDIVHAHSAAAAWSSLAALDKLPVWLVTSLPDRLAADNWWRRSFTGVLTRGDRVIAPSSFVSLAALDRYKIPPEQIVVIPRSVETAAFNPAAVPPERIATVRRAWGMLPDTRAIVVPSPLLPENGQMIALDAARLLASRDRNLIFVFAGDDTIDRKYTRALRRRAHELSIDTLIRFTGHSPDMPAVFAAAAVVALPALQPPDSGRLAAQAQSMARPVVASAIGVLPENLLFPPRMPDDLRTGWAVRPGHAGELATALGAALSLNPTAYEALGARARQFAEHMFSPRSVAEATRAVYTSLLARDV
jgi:glycosyltransferase involved in cell wall biosynthesis